jgi:hypothetical protein
MVGSSKEAEDKTELFAQLTFLYDLPKIYIKYKAYLKKEENKDKSAQIKVALGDQKVDSARGYSAALGGTKAKLFQKLTSYYAETKASDEELVQDIVQCDKGKQILRDFMAFQTKQQKKQKKRVSHEDRISRMVHAENIFDKNTEITVSENEVDSANATYIIIAKNKKTEKKFYVKTFSDDFITLGRTKGKISPNEILNYKLLEYAGFAPKAYFLIALGSSSGGYSSIYQGNYIMTEDAAQEKGAEFILAADLSLNKNEIMDVLTADQENFAIQISSAFLINDLLSLSDTFGENYNNYGVVINQEKSQYSIQFIDHLPDKNKDLSQTIKALSLKKEAYSPRSQLMTKEGENKKKVSQNVSAFFVNVLAKNKTTIDRSKIKAAVNARVFDGGSFMGFDEALSRAKKETNKLIQKYTVNFVDNAEDVLDEYCDKIAANISAYQETEYSEPERQTKSF